ncbi:DUF5059 domain-containing protein [Haladaptatus caseinilyticus]|uniref:DUF5059 domain-containing protein n=1 Tax=Haladaptatus caseinilyticus TaxID=2993314 RepID=UPI00224AA65D|nr:DUF5059 domain-containing protein [Haladaptatus caseinilyticus]
MQTDRRTLLKIGGAAATSSLLAGCGAFTGELNAKDVTAEAAIAAEWNAMRARLHDAFALGVAGEFEAGVSVAENIFTRFEKSSGEWGAHEKLEHTSETQYEEFEEALGQLKTALEDENMDEVKTELNLGNEHLRKAQIGLVGEANVHALDLQLLGARFEDSAMLADAATFKSARTVAERALSAFEDGTVHDELESASSETYESFESAAKTTVSAAKKERKSVVRKQSNAAVKAAVSGSYELGTENAAGAGHIAVMQGQGFDAKALASLGGPSKSFAHAASLNTYRARATDCKWLAEQGATGYAKRMAKDIFAHFEGAKAHEALEHANHDAYEKFEHGLEELAAAAGKGNSKAVEQAVSEIDSSLRTGIAALTTETEAAILQSGFLRARFGDALELHTMGKSEAAATISQSIFERFEKDELGLHETLEHTSEKLYERFEHKHLKEGLIPALKGNGSNTSTHFEGSMQALLDFETKAGNATLVAGAEATFMASRGFDAAGVAKLGNGSRSNAIVEATFEHFENGAGGYHEALEHADHDRYESFEKAFGGIKSANETYAKAKQFGNEAVQSVYAIVGTAGGDFTGAAATIVQDAFQQFETAEVHDLLENGDHAAYEAFENEVKEYASALKSGEGIDAASEAFAAAALRAQFAVVGEVGNAPVGTQSGGEENGETKLAGGPNVKQGVPEDADHVVEMKAVSFSPSELTIKKGDTVAWKHVGGEAHTVTATEKSLPNGASYWASGGFESESKATAGWKNGTGAVQSGQSFVHTFETAGTFEYHCIPHEAAGMTGTIVVE